MAYMLRRFGFYLVAFWVSITLNFFLPRFMPGDPVSRMVARLQGQIRPLLRGRISGEAGHRQCLAIAEKPLRRRNTTERRSRGGADPDEPDPLMAQIDQMLRRRPAAGAIVDVHRRHAFPLQPDEGHGLSLSLERRELLGRELQGDHEGAIGPAAQPTIREELLAQLRS